MNDYIASPSFLGIRRRVYRQGLASGRRAKSIAEMDISYARWRRRWANRPEHLAQRDWLDGFKDGLALED